MDSIKYIKEEFSKKPEIKQLLNHHWNFYCFNDGYYTFEMFFNKRHYKFEFIPKMRVNIDLFQNIEFNYLLDQIEWPVSLYYRKTLPNDESSYKKYYYIPEYIKY